MSSRYSIALEAREERSKLELLIDLVRSNPAVRSCIQRVYNEIVPTAVQVKESGKELAPDLQRFMGPWLAQFLEHALEMAYMCGFVVFVRKRHEGIEVPVLLPLGSFVWAVEAVTAKTRKRKREIACLYRYAVRPMHPEITPDDIFFAGSGAYIFRLAISPLLCDITEIEKIIHVILSNGDVVGFKGHVKNGGSPARQQRFVYGVSMLVIPDLAALCLVVNEMYRKVYRRELLQFRGRAGRVVIPAPLPASFTSSSAGLVS